MEEGKVTVLGVMVSGKPFTEDSEQRTRYRYAVISGLRRLGFVPDDPEHINYVTVLTPSDLNCKDNSLSNIMPYEWLGNFPGKDSVILIWINDDVFRENKTLCSLNYLARWIGLPSDPSKRRNIDFKIIGPSSSDTLKAMLIEANNPDEVKLNALVDVWIYSALATADNSQLLEGVREHQLQEKEAGDAVARIFRREHKINFIRTIRTDRKVCGSGLSY